MKRSGLLSLSPIALAVLVALPACKKDQVTTIPDAGTPAALDSGTSDAGPTAPDAGSHDAGPAKVCTDPDPSLCDCAKASDCGTPARLWLCTQSGHCMHICNRDADCPMGTACENAICTAPLQCGEDSQCTNGQVCIAGSCAATALPTPFTCVVTPAQAVLHQGVKTSFSVVALNSAGAGVPYNGPVTWQTDPVAVASTTDTSTTAAFTGGTQAGAVTIKAAIGRTDCKPAAATNFTAPADAKLRVLVLSTIDHAPIAHASVVAGSAAPVETGADGVALISVADIAPAPSTDLDGGSPDVDAGTADVDGGAGYVEPAAGSFMVSVYHSDFAYLTIVGATGTDVLALVKPKPTVGTFTGTLKPSDFDTLDSVSGSVHFAIYGPSIPDNWLDYDTNRLLAGTVPTKVDVFGFSLNINVAEGEVIGNGAVLWKPDFTIAARPGLRTLWGIGGNMAFGDLQAFGQAQGGNASPTAAAKALSQLQPLVSAFESAVLTGQTIEAGQTKTATFPIDTRPRLRLNAAVPTLPSYDNAGTPTVLNTVLVLTGVRQPQQGFVPLGVTTAGDGTDAQGADGADGIVDPADPNGTPGVIPLLFAPRRNGLEGAPYVTVVAATAVATTRNPPAGSPPPAQSVIIKPTGPVLAQSPSDTPATLTVERPFLAPPSSPKLSAGRTFTMAAQTSGSSLHRLVVGGAAQDGSSTEWDVYFAGAGGPTKFSIPTPPNGFADRLIPGGNDPPVAIVQAVSLNGGQIDFNAMVSFAGETMESLSTKMDAFSSRVVTWTP